VSTLSLYMKLLSKYILFTLGILSIFSACRKEKFTLDPSHNVTVNSDTLWFDTVFTKASSSRPLSVNKQILIKNPYNESIRTSIRLAGGSQSHFRLNVDGEPGFDFTDIEISPNDSIFLFVEVHPDPNNNSTDFNPLIIRDSLLFNTNGNESKTMLIGWGQDAHYIFRDSIEQDTTWANTKLPIVVYGYCYVKPDVKLTIEKGMQLHFAPRSWLFIEGQVDIRGTKDETVLMQGDRLQPDWEEEAGQWGGIWISHPSYGSTIEHATIKNGTVGIYCDSTPGLSGARNVTLRKTMIRNMSFDGISGRGSTIYAENCVSTNCGRFTFLGDRGGDYTLIHNTFYTGGRDFGRNNPTFAYLSTLRDPFTNAILETYDLKFTFLNNIIDGINREGEILGDLEGTIDSQSVIAYNLLKSEEDIYFATGSTNIRKTDENLFIDAYNFNLDLDSTNAPIAKDKAILVSPAITEDHCDRQRDATPDIGAFESQY
jgi:hypothetical protein